MSFKMFGAGVLGRATQPMMLKGLKGFANII
jgi:hypothetical protein